jgi:hypothetical protein
LHGVATRVGTYFIQQKLVLLHRRNIKAPLGQGQCHNAVSGTKINGLVGILGFQPESVQKLLRLYQPILKTAQHPRVYGRQVVLVVVLNGVGHLLGEDFTPILKH